MCGTSLLRWGRVNWADNRILREYRRLAEIESTFRAMEQELGMRPLYHRLEKRLEAHLILTPLA